MIAFFAMNITEFQDMIPMAIEFSRRGKKCWFCIIDSLEKKRQMYFYTHQEIFNFVNTCFEKNIHLYKNNPPFVSFYGHKDESKFNLDYERFNPDKVIVQSLCTHKYPKWLPKIENEKIINLCWSDDSAGMEGNKKTFFNVLKYKHDWDVFDSKENNIFVGNLRYDFINDHVHNISNQISEKIKGERICFIAEAWWWNKKMHNKNNMASKIRKAIQTIKKSGYFVVWKKREKGYPFDDTLSFTKDVQDIVDLSIDRDLFYPSSLYYFSSISNINVIFNWTTAAYDNFLIDSNRSFVFYDSNLIKQSCPAMLPHIERYKRNTGTDKIMDMNEVKFEKHLSEVLKSNLSNKKQNSIVKESASSVLLEEIKKRS